MSCREYQHQISLFLYEELPENHRPGLESHLQECTNCKAVFEEEKGLHFVLAEDAAAFDLPSDLLVESRRELANELDQIERKRSWWRIPAFSVVFTPMRLLESAALIALGLASGVYISNQRASQYVATTTTSTSSSSPTTGIADFSTLPANGSVSNLRIVSANPATGQVELAGEIVQPLRMQGTLSDDTVRQLLVSALGDVSNSGSRLRAVEVLAQRANEQIVKDALIQALIYDENPGVRLKAIQGLRPYASDSAVQAAFMHTLDQDMDAGIRVEAIEALTHNPRDLNLAKALERFTRDDNSYVKMRALQFVGTNR
jgi:hypothetical protein